MYVLLFSMRLSLRIEFRGFQLKITKFMLNSKIHITVKCYKRSTKIIQKCLQVFMSQVLCPEWRQCWVNSRILELSKWRVGLQTFLPSLISANLGAIAGKGLNHLLLEFYFFPFHLKTDYMDTMIWTRCQPSSVCCPSLLVEGFWQSQKLVQIHVLSVGQ